MVVRRHGDLIAWQLAQEFKKEVFAIVEESRTIHRNLRFKNQLIESTRSVGGNIAEGSLRHSAGYFVRFLDYAIGSLGEAEEHLHDGIALKFFAQARCEEAFHLARRCLPAAIGLKQSQLRYLREQKEKRRQPRSKRPQTGPDDQL